MNHNILHSSAAFFPEISGNFGEARMIFEKPAPVLEPIVSQSIEQTEAQKKTEISDALNKSHENFLALQKKVKDGGDEKIDTTEEKALLQTFLTSEKALSFEGVTTDTKIALDALKTAFENEAVLSDLENIDWVHKEIFSQLSEDKQYAEVMKGLGESVKKYLSDVQKKVFEAGLPEDFSAIKEDEKNEIFSKILEIVGDHKGQREIKDDSENTISELTEDAIKFIFNTETLKNSQKIQKNKNTLKKWIKEDIQSKLKDRKKEDYPLIINIKDGELLIKSKKEISKSSESKEETPEILADNEIGKIQKNLSDYRKMADGKTKGFGWLLKMVGIDLGDPNNKGGMYSVLRMMFGFDKIDEAKEYSYEGNSELAKLLKPTPKSLNNLSVPKPTLAEAVSSKLLPAKSQKFLEKPGKEKDRAPIKNMVGDLLGRFQDSQVLSVSTGKIQLKCVDAKQVVEATTFLQSSAGGGSMGLKALEGVMGEIQGKLGNVGGDIFGTFLEENGEQEDSVSEYSDAVQKIREKNGYPEISGYSVGKDKRTITINLSNSSLVNTAKKALGMGEKKAENTPEKNK